MPLKADSESDDKKLKFHIAKHLLKKLATVKDLEEDKISKALISDSDDEEL